MHVFMVTIHLHVVLVFFCLLSCLKNIMLCNKIEVLKKSSNKLQELKIKIKKECCSLARENLSPVSDFTLFFQSSGILVKEIIIFQCVSFKKNRLQVKHLESVYI